MNVSLTPKGRLFAERLKKAEEGLQETYEIPPDFGKEFEGLSAMTHLNTLDDHIAITEHNYDGTGRDRIVMVYVKLNGRIMAYFNESDINRMKSLIPTYIPGKDPSNAVIEMFEGMFGKPYGDEVKIKSSGNKEEYSLILRIRKTQSNTAWIKPMEEFGKIISRADGDLALELLRQIKGDQASLL